MAGYNYTEGMSNNALDAYEDGIKPLSQIASEDLRRVCWRGTKADAIRLAKAGFWKPSEWHHSGGTWYNKVDFYDPGELVNEWNSLNAIEQKTLLENCRKVEPSKDEQKVTGFYTIWGGSRRKPYPVGQEKFEGVKRGNWIYLNDGGKKKANGNHISWELVG